MRTHHTEDDKDVAKFHKRMIVVRFPALISHFTI